MPFEKGESGNPSTQFKPGQSGNPKGMEKGTLNFRTLIREAAETVIDYKDLQNKKITTTAGKGVVLALLGRALYKNDTQAAKLLIEHVDGKQLNFDGDVSHIVKIVNLAGKDEQERLDADRH